MKSITTLYLTLFLLLCTTQTFSQNTFKEKVDTLQSILAKYDIYLYSNADSNLNPKLTEHLREMENGEDTEDYFSGRVNKNWADNYILKWSKQVESSPDKCLIFIFSSDKMKFRDDDSFWVIPFDKIEKIYLRHTSQTKKGMLYAESKEQKNAIVSQIFWREFMSYRGIMIKKSVSIKFEALMNNQHAYDIQRLLNELVYLAQ